MKHIDFSQNLDFPLEQKTLRNMQIGYYEILIAIIGHLGLPDVGNYIISGCAVSGSVIAPGVMYIDGHLCIFAGASGTIATKIKKILTVENAPFFGGSNLPAYFDYSAKVNTGGVALSTFERVPQVPELVNQVVNWADVQGKPQVVIDPFLAGQTPAQMTVLERLELLEKKNAVFTVGGGMVLWNKPLSQIPQGWREVVDWKGRIPVGVDNRLDFIGNALNPEFQSLPALPPLAATDVVPGRTVGFKNVTLQPENIAQHDHEVGRYREYSVYSGGNIILASEIGALNETQGRVKTTKNGGLPNNGGTAPFSILNPLRTVLFIEWIGI